MTWSTIFLIWVIAGAANGVYTIKKEWYQHKIFENPPEYVLFSTVGMMLLCTVAGLVGVAISVWERWFDSSNI